MAETQKNTASGNGGKLTSPEMDREIERLKNDLGEISQHVSRLLSATGDHAARTTRSQANRARRRVDGAISDASELGNEAADAVYEMKDTLADAVEDSMHNRPFTTLAMALAAGFIMGAAWRR